MNTITIKIQWSGLKDHFRSQVIGGMQIEAYRRDNSYGFPQPWEYKLWGCDGNLVCWGMGYTKAEIKRFATRALRVRLDGTT